MSRCHLSGLWKIQIIKTNGTKLSPTQSKNLAAEIYDKIVCQRALAIDGNTKAFEFFQREGWNIFRYLDPDDIDKPSSLFDQLKWLDKAGFKDVDVFWLQAGHAIFG